MNVHEKNYRMPPAVKSATSYLERLLDSENYSPGKKLPSIHCLAKNAGVSLVTMWKAVNGLKKRGILSVIQGQGITILKPGEQNTDYSQKENFLECIHKKKKWEIVRDTFYQDIINGIYPQDEELPSLKEICYRYHTSFSTLKKAFTDLADENIIVPGRQSDISVIGFDDTFEAFNHNFSSFNFNIDALANSMFSFILYPRSFRQSLTEQNTVKIQGMMIKRRIRDLSVS